MLVIRGGRGVRHEGPTPDADDAGLEAGAYWPTEASTVRILDRLGPDLRFNVHADPELVVARPKRVLRCRRGVGEDITARKCPLERGCCAYPSRLLTTCGGLFDPWLLFGRLTRPLRNVPEQLPDPNI